MKWTALFVLLAGCSGREPEAPPRPTVLVVLPAGPASDDRVAAIRAALEPTYAVERLDESPTAPAQANANPAAVGALAHLSAEVASAAAPAWKAGDLPVISLAGTADLPRLALSPDELARCATGLADAGRALVVHDGEAAGVAAATRVAGVLEGRVDEVLGLAPDTISADAARVLQRSVSAVFYTGGLRQGGDLLRLLRPQGFDTPFLALGESPEAFFASLGGEGASGEASAGWVVTSDRAPLFSEPLEQLSAQLGHGPAGPTRTAFDAARVLRAALDLASKGPDGLPRRADVKTALDQVIGVGTGGPLALVNGGPSPAQCTAYAPIGAELRAVAAAQVNADGSVTRVALGESPRAGAAAQ